jgi:hypothetical protein
MSAIAEQLDSFYRYAAERLGNGGAELSIDELFERWRLENLSAEEGRRGENFVDRARRLDATGRTDLALDLLYDAIDQLLRESKFDELNAILCGLPIAECSLDLLLGFLTATLPARTKLPSRPQFFADVKAELQNRGEFEVGLLTGLE